ncbi:MAG: hypothetical protein ACK4Y6_06520 [Bacteroidota bacterium]
MDIQLIIVAVLVAAACVYLIKTLVLSSNSNTCASGKCEHKKTHHTPTT